MKATIEITSNYGFDHNWTLVLTKSNGLTKSFYLGQDVKFCSRVLCMEPHQVIDGIGSRDLSNPKTKAKLARFIVNTLELSFRELFKQEPWALCAQ